MRHVYVTKLLKIELNIAHRNINRSQIEIFCLVRDISNHLSIDFIKKFFRRQEAALYFLHTQEIHRINKKIKIDSKNH